MIVDASALIAILRNEPEAPAFARALADAVPCRLSGVNFVEASVVADRINGYRGPDLFDRIVRDSGIEVVPVTVEQAQEARTAYMIYGKGRHPAGLNLGDCFAYALAKVSGEPLLFKGGDFGKTDVESAL